MGKTKVQTERTNYVRFEQSYCHRLEPRLKQLYFLYMSNKISLRYMKNVIYKIVQGSRVTDKYGWFLNTVRESKTKKSLYWLCHNSIVKARNTTAEVPVTQ